MTSLPRSSGCWQAGESLIEVILALSMLAMLSLTFAQTQLSQYRSQRIVSNRLIASALLDEIAEVRRMGESVSGIDWQTRIAEQLVDGRLDMRRDQDAVQLVISWRETEGPPPGFVSRCRPADTGASTSERVCESIVVPALSGNDGAGARPVRRVW